MPPPKPSPSVSAAPNHSFLSTRISSRQTTAENLGALGLGEASLKFVGDGFLKSVSVRLTLGELCHARRAALPGDEKANDPRYGSTGKPMVFQAAKPPARNLTRENPSLRARPNTLRLVFSLGHVQ